MFWQSHHSRRIEDESMWKELPVIMTQQRKKKFSLANQADSLLISFQSKDDLDIKTKIGRGKQDMENVDPESNYIL